MNSKIWLSTYTDTCFQLCSDEPSTGTEQKSQKVLETKPESPQKMLITAELPLQTSPKSLILADTPIQNQKSEDKEESSYASIHSSHQIKN